MRRIALAWIVWLGGVGLLVLVDYLLRVSDGDIRTGGVPALLGAVLLILLGAVSLWLLYRAMPRIELWKRLALVGVQAAVGYSVGAVIGIYYVCGTGIDCF
jgi:uncharacterized BrkB/YihY/UPF0761 family membrane protein